MSYKISMENSIYLAGILLGVLVLVEVLLWVTKIRN